MLTIYNKEDIWLRWNVAMHPNSEVQVLNVREPGMLGLATLSNYILAIN